MKSSDWLDENFADGKVKGKSRPGRVKRAGASCKGSVTALRSKAGKYGGERGKMYRWCANMKSGKQKTNESVNSYHALHAALSDFLPLAMKLLKIDKVPKITLEKTIGSTNQPTFGVFTGNKIRLGVEGRHPADVCRTLAHELVHYKQKINGQLKPNSGDTGSSEENQANSQAGIIMREFNKEFPHHLEQ
jgi:hypothetical protein